MKLLNSLMLISTNRIKVLGLWLTCFEDWPNRILTFAWWMLQTRNTMFSWQAFPSLPPLAPLAFPSRQNFLSLPFQTPTTQAVARLCFKRRATAVLKSNLIRAIVQTLIFYHARSTDFEEKTRGSVKAYHVTAMTAHVYLCWHELMHHVY